MAPEYCAKTTIFPNVSTVQLIQWFVFTFLMNWFAPGYSKEINSHCIAWLVTAMIKALTAVRETQH